MKIWLFFKSALVIVKDKLGLNIKESDKRDNNNKKIVEATSYNVISNIYEGELGSTLTLTGTGFLPNIDGRIVWHNQQGAAKTVLDLNKYYEEIRKRRISQIDKLRQEVSEKIFASIEKYIKVDPISETVNTETIIKTLSKFSPSELGYNDLTSSIDAAKEYFKTHADAIVGYISLQPADINKLDIILKLHTDNQGNFSTSFKLTKELNPRFNHQTIEVLFEADSDSIFPYKFSQSSIIVLKKIIETIFLALLATSIGVIFALPLSFLGASNIMRVNLLGTTIYFIVRFFMNIIRSIEPMIIVLIAIVWVGAGPFAGVIALAFHGMASLGKLYSEQIEQIDSGPIEAIMSTGANRIQTILYGVVPQVVPSFLAFTIYRWDIDIRMSTIIGLVGGGGIGQVLIQWIQKGNYNEAGIAIIAIIIVVTIMDSASAYFRKKLL